MVYLYQINFLFCSSLHLININVNLCSSLNFYLKVDDVSKFVFDNCKKLLVSSDSRISEYLHRTEFKLVFLTWSKFDTHQIMCFLQLQQNFLTFIFSLLLEDWPCSLELCSSKPSLPLNRITSLLSAAILLPHDLSFHIFLHLSLPHPHALSISFQFYAPKLCLERREQCNFLLKPCMLQFTLIVGFLKPFGCFLAFWGAMKTI